MWDHATWRHKRDWAAALEDAVAATRASKVLSILRGPPAGGLVICEGLRMWVTIAISTSTGNDPPAMLVYRQWRHVSSTQSAAVMRGHQRMQVGAEGSWNKCVCRIPAEENVRAAHQLN